MMNNLHTLQQELKKLKHNAPFVSLYRIKIPYEDATSKRIIVATIAYIFKNDEWHVGVTVQSKNDSYCKLLGEVKARTRLMYNPLMISTPFHSFGLLAAKEALYHFMKQCARYKATKLGTMGIVTNYLSSYV